MDQGAACDCRYRLDGGHALSAAAVHLSLRRGSRIETIRDLQGDGTPVAESDHQSGDDRDMAGGTLRGLGRALVGGRLVARKAAACAADDGRPRVFLALCEGFCRGPEYQKPEVLPYYQ